MPDKRKGQLKRPRYPMPAFVCDALHERDHMDEYRERPPYQQSDYIWWIISAKREETKMKRLEQMLDELERGCFRYSEIGVKA